MAKMDHDLARVAAAIYQMIDENRENDELLNRLSVITYYLFQHDDSEGQGEGAFFNLDEWIDLLSENNEGNNPHVIGMAADYGKGN